MKYQVQLKNVLSSVCRFDVLLMQRFFWTSFAIGMFKSSQPFFVSVWFDIKTPVIWVNKLFTHLTRREIIFFNWVKIKDFKRETWSDIKAVINAKRWARTARLSLMFSFAPLVKLILFLNCFFLYNLLGIFHHVFSSVSGNFSFHADYISSFGNNVCHKFDAQKAWSIIFHHNETRASS